MLQVPNSTPAAAVKHDMGVTDMDLEVAMERIILASKILQMSDCRISKKLLTSMLEKEIPGFCTSLRESLSLLGLSSITEIDSVTDKRKHLKKLVIQIQRTRIVEEMLVLSKTDRMLMNINYDGQLKQYLLKLPFEEARIIFLWRCRMFPTKCNYPSRWSASRLCNFCCMMDTDEHLLNCCGFMDIHRYQINHQMFMNVDGDMNELSYGAKILMKIYERLLLINEDKDLNSSDP